jgi:hypothetical protein
MQHQHHDKQVDDKHVAPLASVLLEPRDRPKSWQQTSGCDGDGCLDVHGDGPTDGSRGSSTRAHR